MEEILDKTGIDFTREEKDQIFQALRDLNLGANEIVITRAAEKGLEQLMRLDPKVVREAISMPAAKRRLARVVLHLKVSRMSPVMPRLLGENPRLREGSTSRTGRHS